MNALGVSGEKAPALGHRLSTRHRQFLRGVEFPKRFDLVQPLQFFRAVDHLRFDQLPRSRKEAVGRRGHPHQQFPLKGLRPGLYPFGRGHLDSSQSTPSRIVFAAQRRHYRDNRQKTPGETCPPPSNRPTLPSWCARGQKPAATP